MMMNDAAAGLHVMDCVDLVQEQAAEMIASLFALEALVRDPSTAGALRTAAEAMLVAADAMAFLAHDDAGSSGTC